MVDKGQLIEFRSETIADRAASVLEKTVNTEGYEYPKIDLWISIIHGDLWISINDQELYTYGYKNGILDIKNSIYWYKKIKLPISQNINKC